MAENNFNLLIDELPSTVEVDGSSFFINTDYRYGLLFNQLIDDGDIDDKQKILQALEIGFTDEIPKNIEEGFRKLIYFYSCLDLDNKDLEDVNNEIEESVDDNEQSEALFDYTKDTILIYSTFMQVYHIDLVEVNMHWYKFMALLRALFDENNLTKVLQFRAMKIDGKMTPDMKKYYTKMKQHYSLNRYSKKEKDELKNKMMEEWG